MYQNIKVGMYLNVFAGVTYIGEVTEVEETGFWITEDKKTEEFVFFADVEEVKKLFTNIQSNYQDKIYP